MGSLATILWALFAGPVAIVAVFFVVFAFKVAHIEWRTRKHQPGGFEVKPITGELPVLEERDRNNG